MAGMVGAVGGCGWDKVGFLGMWPLLAVAGLATASLLVGGTMAAAVRLTCRE
jgi:hypothetical protein